jgi:hypothetical protein
MSILSVIFIQLVNLFFDPISVLLASLLNEESLWVIGGGIVAAFAMLPNSYGDIQEVFLERAKKWHGSIADRFANVDHLYTVSVNEVHQKWTLPDDIKMLLTEYVMALRILVPKCEYKDCTPKERAERDTMLKTTVELCLGPIKLWVFGMYAQGLMTLDEVHRLGFLLPGEHSKHRDRTEATDVIAVATTRIISAEAVCVVIDQADAKNAALVVHGWPQGVTHALIVITDEQGNVVYRQITSKLHTDITMPEGSRGKLFYVRAAFLKHMDDAPRFGPQPSFTMPYITEDVAKLIKKQYEEEVEQHRLEVERLLEENRRLRGQG